MKQLDEMERMAREALARFPSHEYPSPAAAMRALAAVRADREPDIARALLAAMPTIRAALDWRDHGPGQSHCAEEDCPCTSPTCRLKIAIDEMRRRLGGE